MRKFALAIAAAGFFALPTSAFSQSVEFGPGGVQIEPGYGYDHGYHYGHRYGRTASRGQCRELRLACLHKEELGEEGQGAPSGDVAQMAS